MTLITELEKLIKHWKERRTYQGLQSREAFEAKDMERQATLINNSKQIQNCINDLQKVVNES